jgi:hypothetical protein
VDGGQERGGVQADLASPKGEEGGESCAIRVERREGAGEYEL